MNKEMCFDIHVALGLRSERNAAKNREPTLGFSFTTMLQHTGRYYERIF